MAEPSNWTFFTNHAHVMVCLARNGDRPLREIAIDVGITERAVQRIIADLEEGGYLKAHRTIGDLLRVLAED
jgi:DNA-binding Lrp family transcriptional regulator